MAINAANDHNTDADRATLQKEFSQRMEQIDDIAATTNYNGKILLDGRYGTLHTIATSSTSSSSSATPMPDKSPSVILAEQEKHFYDMTRKDDLAVTGSSPYTMPTHAATYTTDSTGNITITSSGVFTLPTSKGTAITITVDASDVVIKGTGDKESEEEIVVTRPNAHLWIDDVRLNNGNHPCIKFTGSGNALMLLGRNLLSDASTKETKAGSFSFPALLDVGEGLTIYNGSSTQEGILYATASSDLMAIAAIGGDNASAHLTIESGTVIAQGYYGAAIGSSQKGSFGDIAINGGRVYALTKAGAAAIGAGSTVGSSTTSAGNISIGKIAIVETFTHGGAGIGTGANSYGVESSAKSITIDSTNVRFFSCYGEAIGSAMGYPSSPHMIVDKWHFLVPDNPVFTGNVGSVSVASGSYLNSFYDATDSKTRYHYFVGSTFSEDGYNHFGTDPTSDPSSSDVQYTWNPLIIHTGTKTNQNLHLRFNDMHTKAMGLNGTNLTPREAAIAALSRLDKAVDYALDESTRMGAYSSRLDLTISNLTTSNENTQSSESTIRDADMAKEMTAYTKASILAQSSQAMLAQANQNASSSLRLLE